MATASTLEHDGLSPMIPEGTIYTGEEQALMIGYFVTQVSPATQIRAIQQAPDYFKQEERSIRAQQLSVRGEN